MRTAIALFATLLLPAFSSAADRDGDGIENANDNCELTFNARQVDDDGDGIGNLCDDTIRGQPDDNESLSDADGDSVADEDELQFNGFDEPIALKTESEIFHLTAADLNGDDRKDLVWTGADGVFWAENYGGELGDTIQLSEDAHNRLVVGDLNDDGLEDVIAYVSGVGFFWFENLGAPIIGGGSGAPLFANSADLGSAPSNIRRMVMVDVDGDSDDDLIVQDSVDGVLAFFSPGDGTLPDSGSEISSSDGDFNVFPGSGIYYVGDETGTIEAVDFQGNTGSVGNAPFTITGIAAGDYDRDGDLDVFAGSEFDGFIELYENESLGYAEGLPLSTDLYPQQFAIADLEWQFDNDFDLIIGESNELSWMDVSARSRTTIDTISNVNFVFMEVFDVDGDGVSMVDGQQGRMDIIATHQGDDSDTTTIRFYRASTPSDPRLADTDGDGSDDGDDAFPRDPNETADSNGDGVGDNSDPAPNDPAISQDSDGDGVADSIDEFPNDPNETVDTDGDGVGDNADTDDDNDGVPDSNDAFPKDASETSDWDGDGIGDNADNDDDNDGVNDSNDAFPLDPTETRDTDGDGIGDNADPDDNNDGIDDDVPEFSIEDDTRSFSQSENRVLGAYLAYFGRPGDLNGLNYWSGELQAAGGNLDAIINAFGTSDEFDRRFGDLSNTELIENLYQQVLGRAPDPVGRDYWLGELESGSRTLEEISLSILDGVQGDDVATVDNRLAFARLYVSLLEDGDITPLADVDLAGLIDVIDETDASVDQAITELRKTQ